MCVTVRCTVADVFSDGMQAGYGRDASGKRMLWVGYGILLISRMTGKVDGVLAFPSV